MYKSTGIYALGRKASVPVGSQATRHVVMIVVFGGGENRLLQRFVGVGKTHT